MLHGKENATKSENTAKNIFEDKNVQDYLPTIYIDLKEIDKKISILDLFVINNSLLSSKNEARRLIRGGGAKINNQTIKDENLVIDKSFFSSAI